MEEQELPAWLKSLRDQQLKQLQAADSQQSQMDQANMEDQELPSWLDSLRDSPPKDQPRAAEDQWDQASPAQAEDQQIPEWFASPLQPQPGEQAQAAESEEPQEQTIPADMMESLREQMIQSEGVLEYGPKPSLVQFFRTLAPWKRLILAVLLFLDVALCGCMGLVMAGRVMLPF
jgi:hypothetical protein